MILGSYHLHSVPTVARLDQHKVSPALELRHLLPKGFLVRSARTIFCVARLCSLSILLTTSHITLKERQPVMLRNNFITRCRASTASSTSLRVISVTPSLQVQLRIL